MQGISKPLVGYLRSSGITPASLTDTWYFSAVALQPCIFLSHSQTISNEDMPLLPETTTATPSTEEILDLVEAARYGELDTLQDFIARYGSSPIREAVDEHGLTPLHMASANGHEGLSSLTRHEERAD